MQFEKAASGEGSRFRMFRAGVVSASLGDDVRAGLTASRKSLPPRWFYDDLGSSLFDTICFLPEYYVMRAEAEVLTWAADSITRAFGPRIRLVELGSGAARKTRILLDAICTGQPDLEYVPVDIDASMLERSGQGLLADYPWLRVTAVQGDITRPSSVLRLLGPTSGRTVVLFLGSTIGNFDPAEAVALLADLRSSLSPGDALLLGADLKKSRAVLEPAYDDPLGVTAAFNMNLLVRINRELGADFDLASFRHHAFYDEQLGRIEMHLVSRNAQRVFVRALDLEISFEAEETIHTESSWKHDESTLAKLAGATGFGIEGTWTDSRGWFADVLMVAR